MSRKEVKYLAIQAVSVTKITSTTEDAVLFGSQHFYSYCQIHAWCWLYNILIALSRTGPKSKVFISTETGRKLTTNFRPSAQSQ